VLHAARWKYTMQKCRKKSPSAHHRTILSGYIFTTKVCINNRKTLVKQQHPMSYTCPHNMANFGPLTAEIGSRVWGTPGNFNGFRVLPSLLQRRRSPEANQTLRDVWPSPGLVRYKNVHFQGSCPLAEFCPGVSQTLRRSS